MNLFADKATGRQMAVELKQRVRDLLGLPKDTVIVVSELACPDESCPPMMVVVSVMEDKKKPRKFQWHKKLSEMTIHDLGLLFLNDAS